MTDLPPRTTPPQTDGRRAPDIRTSQSSMWIVLLVLAAVIIAAIVFSMDRSDSVVDETATEPTATTTEPAATAPEPAPATIEPAPADGTDTGTAPATGTDDAAPAEPATPAPGAGGTTTSP